MTRRTTPWLATAPYALMVVALLALPLLGIFDLSLRERSATSLSGAGFTTANYARLAEPYPPLPATGDEIARYNLTGSGRHTAQIMAKLTRNSGRWTMTALGEIASGRTMHDLLPVIRTKL